MADGSIIEKGDSREKGAESSGEVGGLGWRVFRVIERGKERFVLLAYVAPGVRRKMRLPVEQRRLTTPELRARFARGAATQMIRDHQASTRTTTTPPASAEAPNPS